MRGGRAWAIALVLAVGAPSRPLRGEPLAEPTTERCLSAYEQGQRLRKKQQLKKSRSELLICARAPCPVAFRDECSTWFDEVDKLVPSVIIRVHGAPARAPIRVVIDGAEAGEASDGTPIELDPGEHDIWLDAKGQPTVKQHISIAEGEKLRVVSFVWAELSGRPTEYSSKPSPLKPTLTPWIFAGLGLVSLGSFAYFGITGLSQRSSLDECDSFCRQQDIDSTRRRFLIADVSLGLSALSFGVATILWLRPSPATTSSAPARRWQVTASALQHVAVVGILGEF